MLRYRVSLDFQHPGKPVWEKSDILIPHVAGLEEVLKKTLERVKREGVIPPEEIDEMEREMAEDLQNPLAMRLGFMPRAHPLVRSDGTLVVPLSNENIGIPVMAMTNDGGDSWTFSNPVPEAGLTPTNLGRVSRWHDRGLFPQRAVGTPDPAK